MNERSFLSQSPLFLSHFAMATTAAFMIACLWSIEGAPNSLSVPMPTSQLGPAVVFQDEAFNSSSTSDSSIMKPDHGLPQQSVGKAVETAVNDQAIALYELYMKSIKHTSNSEKITAARKILNHWKNNLNRRRWS